MENNPLWFDNKSKIIGVGVYDGLSSVLASSGKINTLWASSYSISSSQGLPDNGILSLEEFKIRLMSIRRMSDLPILADVGNGFSHGKVFNEIVQSFTPFSKFAVSIEDYETGYKISSLYKAQYRKLMNKAIFCERIKQISAKIPIIARTEALVAGKELNEALTRAELYLDSGASGIFLQFPKDYTVEKVRIALREFRSLDTPIIISPSFFGSTKISDFYEWGANLVLASNQIVRFIMRNCETLIKNILRNNVLEPAGSNLMSIEEYNAIFDKGMNSIVTDEFGFDNKCVK